MPPAAPDYSSLVAASERQPTPCFPSDFHIVSCDSGAACHSDKNGGGGGYEGYGIGRETRQQQGILKQKESYRVGRGFMS